MQYDNKFGIIVINLLYRAVFQEERKDCTRTMKQLIESYGMINDLGAQLVMAQVDYWQEKYK